mmetsp:Transcript_13995/g.15463  ORF Transcript_13995/g.15463 Transcript_13995/m.15463 type:complete len:485 (-) Transcript_13995:110-1564(-)
MSKQVASKLADDAFLQSKRQKLPKDILDKKTGLAQIQHYPIRVAATPVKYSRQGGLGHFFVFDYKFIREFLDDFLSTSDILSIGCCSRAWKYCCDDERLWKRFTRRRYKGNIVFKGTWKRSVVNWHNRNYSRRHKLPYKDVEAKPLDLSLAPNFRGMEAELLKAYKLWYRTTADPAYWERTCPEHIPRVSNISVEEFIEKYENPGKPVIITDVMNNWKAMKKWNKAYMLKKYGKVKFRTGGGFRMRLDRYISYFDIQQETVPLYLFDQNYVKRASDMLKDYEVPKYFREDLFKHVGERDRPPYRWILLGPARSGAPFHTDPRGTSAWNGVVRGTKRWALYPPHIHPPGVGPDDSEYYNAPCPIKWYTETYPTLKPDQMPLECLHKEGEMLFIPSGWWHQVYNLGEMNIAMTQNYASTANFKRVAADLVRDGDSFYKQFRRKITKVRPDLFKQMQEIEETTTKGSTSSSSSSASSSSELSDTDSG